MPLTPAARSRVVFWATALGAMMTSLDLSIGNVALPSIARSFPDASASSLSWVLNAYTVVYGAMLITAGRLADLRGVRRIYAAGVAVFTASSLAITAAPTIGVLIAARAVQGLGASLITPASLAILIAAAHQSREVAVAKWSTLHAVAVILGPTLGGTLVAAGTWRAAFAINVPIGIAVLVLVHRLVPESTVESHRQVDVLGAALICVAAAAGVGSLAELPRHGLGAPVVLTLIAVCLAAVAALTVHLRRHPDPVLDRDLLRSRWIQVTTLGTLAYSAGFFGLFTCSIVELIHVWRYSDRAAGLSFTLGPAVVFFTARRFGRLATRTGTGPIIAVGGLLLALGAWWALTFIGPTPQFFTGWLPGHLIVGLGVATAFTCLGAAAVIGVPQARLSSATGLNQTARQLGGAIGVALVIGLIGNPLSDTAAGYRNAWIAVIVAMLLSAVSGVWLTALVRPRGDLVQGPPTDRAD